MGLRDRGYVLDFYIPIFAGVDAAKRDRFRTKVPFSIYAPYYSGGGTCTPGGIGGGDGGFGTPIDFAISTPTIISPAPGSTTVETCDAIVASAFASSDGETQIASRWMIEQLNQVLVPGGPVSCTQYKVIPADGTAGARAYRDNLTQALEDWRSAHSYVSAFFGTNDGRGAGCFTGGPQTLAAGLIQGSPCCGVDGAGTIFSAGAGATTWAERTGVYCTSGDSYAPVNTPTGIYVYDSGPTTVYPNDLPLTGLGLNPGKSYRVTVRYKGSNGGWSDWSVPEVFTMAPCGPDCA